MLTQSRAKACEECRRQKKKCIVQDRDTKCTYCKIRGVECSLKINSLCALNSLTPHLLADTELSRYFGLTCTFTTFSWAIGMDLELLQNSPLSSHKCIKYGVAALAARSCGNEKHYKGLISDAVRFSSVEDISPASFSGFLFLSFFWLGTLEMKQFAQAAIHIFDRLTQKDKDSMPPIQIMYLSICRHLLSQQELAFKIDNFLDFCGVVDPHTNEENFYVSVIRLFIRVFGTAAGNNLDYNRIDGLAVLLCHIQFTPEQREDILKEVQHAKSILVQNPKSVYIQAFSLEYLTIFVNWKSGYTQLALKQAIQCAEELSGDLLLFGSKFEGLGLLSISILLYDFKYFDLSYKLHKAAQNLHSVFCQNNHSLFEECLPMFSYFLQACLAPYAPVPGEIFNDEARIHSIVMNFLAIVSSFIPERDYKKLVSPHGLYVWYKSFTALCPVQLSTYKALEPVFSFPISSTLTPLPDDETISFITSMPLENSYSSLPMFETLTQF